MIGGLVMLIEEQSKEAEAFSFISGSVLEMGHSLLVGVERSGNDDCF